MSISVGPNDATAGLVLYLDAANNKSYPGSGTAWTDLSGNGNNSTLTNSPTYNSNGTFSLNGTTQYFYNATPNLPSGNTPFTTSVWVYSNYKGTNSIHPNLISWGSNSTGNKNGLALQTDVSGNAQILHWFFGNDNTWTITDITNTWANVAVTYNGTSLTLYINGVIIGAVNPPSTPSVTGTTNLEIGNFTASSTYAFNGNISIVSVYNIALTQSQIQQNFQAHRGRYGI